MQLSILQRQNCQNNKLVLLERLDLAEWEAEHHWAQFAELTLAAQYHLTLHEEACVRRKALDERLTCALRDEPPEANEGIIDLQPQKVATAMCLASGGLSKSGLETY